MNEMSFICINLKKKNLKNVTIKVCRQVNPVMTDLRRLTSFIYYWWIFVTANKGDFRFSLIHYSCNDDTVNFVYTCIRNTEEFIFGDEDCNFIRNTIIIITLNHAM